MNPVSALLHTHAQHNTTLISPVVDLVVNPSFSSTDGDFDPLDAFKHLSMIEPESTVHSVPDADADESTSQTTPQGEKVDSIPRENIGQQFTFDDTGQQITFDDKPYNSALCSIAYSNS